MKLLNRFYMRYLYAMVFMLVIIVNVLTASGQTPERRDKVLVLHSYHQGLLWTDDITRGINHVFKNEPNIELHFEYLDSKRNTDSSYFRALYNLYRVKHHTINYKVIIVSDNNALEFVKRYRQEFFEDIPIVFCAIDQFTNSLIAELDKVTGVTEEIDFKKTVELILQLHPSLDTLVIINDNITVSAIINRNYIKSFWPDLGTSVSYRFLENLSIPELSEELRKLPDNQVILLTNFSRDDKQQFISYQENIALIKEATSLPVYSGWDFYLGRGIVGGMLTSGFDQGRLAAEKALSIIRGANVDVLPIARSGYNHYAFDYNELIRHNIPLQLLPQEYALINEPPGFYEKNRGVLLISGGLILFFTLLIVRNEYRNRLKARRLVLMNRELDARVEEKTQALQQANESLTEQNDKIEEQNKELATHRHHLMELVSARTADLEQANRQLENARRRLLMMLDVSSDGVWEYNIAQGTFTMGEQTWVRLGYQAPDNVTSLAEVDDLIHPDDKDHVIANRQNYLQDPRRSYAVEFRMRAKQGSWHWLYSRGKVLDWDNSGKPHILVGTHIDITERKYAEAQLRQEQARLQASERRWRALYEQAQEEIMLLDLQGIIIDANPAACNWLKYEPQALLGQNLSSVHQDLSESSLRGEHLCKLSDLQPSRTFDSVQVCSDGTTFPVEVNINLVSYEGGEFILAIIRNLSRRQEVERQVLKAIIRTEEQERSRFARDMHDSIGPLLSSLKLYLSSMQKAATEERKVQVAQLAQQAIDESIATIRQISSNLSPQILEDYGLESALKAFLHRLESAKLLETTLQIEMPHKRVPQPVELALYRICTELINNTLKHAGATAVTLIITKSDGNLQVKYTDNGKGIGPTHSAAPKGMGFSNIESRLKSIAGTWYWKAPEEQGFEAVIQVPVNE